MGVLHGLVNTKPFRAIKIGCIQPITDGEWGAEKETMAKSSWRHHGLIGGGHRSADDEIAVTTISNLNPCQQRQ
ncbi:hypothetical protein [Mycolicibacterium sp. XJ879]